MKKKPLKRRKDEPNEDFLTRRETYKKGKKKKKKG